MALYCTASFNDLNGLDFIGVKLEDVAVNSVGALSQAPSHELISRSPIFLYLVIVEVSLTRSTITVVTENEIWPKCFSIILLSSIVLENHSIVQL